MATVVQPMIEPNRDAIKAHLEQLFAPCWDEYPNGLIELRHGPPENLTGHAYFFVSERGIDMAAKYACDRNRQGENVYVGVNPRKPGTKSQASANDIEISFFHFADIDKAAAVEGLVERYSALPPTMTVTTGNVPNKRPHLYWRLEEPVRNLGDWTERQRGIAQALGGDAVIDPPRIMRLGGTVNFPTQKKLGNGYRVELTTLRTSFAVERLDVTPDQIRKAYPVDTDKHHGDQNVEDITTLAAMARGDGLSPAAYIGAILAGDNWHNHYRDLVAHWVGIGWSDAEILLTAAALTLPGYSLRDTEKKVAGYTLSARRKFNVPNPVIVVEPVKLSEGDFAPTPWSCIDPKDIPPREWLFGDFLVRRFVSLLVAPPGVGKSTFTLHVAVAAALKIVFGPYQPHEQVNVWIFNNEDPRDELDRRISAILLAQGISPSELAGRLFVDTGQERHLTVARRDGKTGAVIQLPVVDAVIAHIKSNKIGLWIVDPFLETHEVSENSNEEINKVARMYRRIAQETGCAVWLVHHTRKPASSSPGGTPGDADSARGAGSLGGVVRFASTLFPMSEADAKSSNIDEEERHLYVRLDDAKANLKLKTNNATWWKKISVDLNNAVGFRASDEVGALEYAQLAGKKEAKKQRGDEDWNLMSHVLCMAFDGNSITLNRAATLLASAGEQRGYTSHRSIERFLEEHLSTPKRVGAWEFRFASETRKGGSRWIDRRSVRGWE